MLTDRLKTQVQDRHSRLIAKFLDYWCPSMAYVPFHNLTFPFGRENSTHNLFPCSLALWLSSTASPTQFHPCLLLALGSSPPPSPRERTSLTAVLGTSSGCDLSPEAKFCRQRGCRHVKAPDEVKKCKWYFTLFMVLICWLNSTGIKTDL